MQLLVESFNPAAADGLMCRDTLSVGWDGRWGRTLGAGKAAGASAAAANALPACGCATIAGRASWSRRCASCWPLSGSSHVCPAPCLPARPAPPDSNSSPPSPAGGPPCSLYDCDFNQQLGLGLPRPGRRSVFDLDSLADLTGEHRGLLWGLSGACLELVWGGASLGRPWGFAAC